MSKKTCPKCGSKNVKPDSNNCGDKFMACGRCQWIWDFKKAES